MRTGCSASSRTSAARWPGSTIPASWPLDFGLLPDGSAFLVLERVEGTTLDARLEQGPLDLQAAADVARQVGRALGAAHAEGILHRDLKPANVMLYESDGERRLKLIDFGIAALRDPGQDATHATSVVAGTSAYMPPEQRLGKTSARSDIFAMGVMLYQALTGRLPFAGRDDSERVGRMLAGDFPRPRQLRPTLPAAAEACLVAALAAEPQQRPGDAQHFGASLADALRAQPAPGASAPPASPAERTLPLQAPARRFWRPAHVLLALVALVGSGLGAGLAWRLVMPQAEHNPPSRTPGAESPQALPAVELRYALELRTGARSCASGPAPRLVQEAHPFRSGDCLRLHLEVAHAGQLYVVNQGPDDAGHRPQFNLLWPQPGQSADVRAGSQVVVPADDWLRFDAEHGTERVWLLLARDRDARLVSGLSRLRAGAGGELRDVAQRQALDALLRQAPRPASVSVRDDAAGGRVLSGGDPLVHVLRLEHR